VIIKLLLLEIRIKYTIERVAIYALRYKIVKQLLEDGIISLDYVRSELNISDLFNKPLGRQLVENTTRGMELMSIIKSQK